MTRTRGMLKSGHPTSDTENMKLKLFEEKLKEEILPKIQIIWYSFQEAFIPRNIF